MPRKAVPNTEKAFALYVTFSADERQQFAALCRGYDAAQVPKPAAVKFARKNRAPKATAEPPRMRDPLYEPVLSPRVDPESEAY